MEGAMSSPVVPPRIADPNPPSTAPATILVVDDSRLNRRLLQGILAREDCRVIEAADGRAAVALAASERPDLVLLDILMPGMDGYEVCAALKAERRLAEIPVIVLSALSEPADKVKALELGAVDYVTKPFDKGEVLARVRNQLRIQRLTASLRDANRELVAQQRELDADLRAAADIQKSLIPRALPDVGAVELASSFVPCSSVGGDIFNVQRLDDDHVAVWLVDVSGHGVPAAMVTVSVCQSLSLHAGIVLDGSGRPRPPARVLEHLDREFPIERFDKYFTMTYLVLELSTGLVRYCNAAHPPPVLVRHDGSLELFEEGGTIVGLGGVMPYEEGSAVLQPGDRLFLYTDGIVDFVGAGGEEFGAARLHEVLTAGAGHGLRRVCDRLVAALEAFGGDKRPNDDVTVVALDYRGPVASLGSGSGRKERTRPAAGRKAQRSS